MKYPIKARINTPATDISPQGRYHGIEVLITGQDSEGLFLCELPAIGEVPSYTGRFTKEYLQRLEA